MEDRKRPLVLGLALLWSLIGVCLGADVGVKCDSSRPLNQSLFQFEEWDVYHQKKIALDIYKSKVTLVVNVATFWGLNYVHYTGMNALKAQYSMNGFDVLAFPCNQFDMVRLAYVCCFTVDYFVDVVLHTTRHRQSTILWKISDWIWKQFKEICL